ncbi:MAG: AfsR/SARP family transcriptional regulator, partial [Actinomycetota bacterium]
MLDLFLLGRFRALRDGAEIPSAAFRGKLGRSLVALLVARRDEFLSRERLVDALWPRDPPSDPGASLKVLVSAARHALGDPSLIATGSGGYTFSSGGDVSVDAEDFLG